MTAVITRAMDTSKVDLLDCTLRDGSYAVDFQFDENFVAELLAQLDQTPIGQIEIGHGLGIEAETAGIAPCNIDLDGWCAIANSTIKNKRWGMFAQPAFTSVDTIARLSGEGMSFVRVGMDTDTVPHNLDYIRRAVDACDTVYLNLMKTSDTPADRLPEFLGGLPHDVRGIYIVDSFGGMLPSDVVTYVTTALEFCETVGFHGHDNLGLANVNSIVALEAGASIADGTLNGIGRGAGNAQLEALAGIIKLLDSDLYDYEQISKLAEYCRANMNVIPDNREMQVLGGVIGMHSGYFPLVEELAAECAVPPARLMELATDLTGHSAGKADIQTAAEDLAGRPLHTLPA
jgi:4-hydroxy 2-oxovalerate aldolase